MNAWLFLGQERIDILKAELLQNERMKKASTPAMSDKTAAASTASVDTAKDEPNVMVAHYDQADTQASAQLAGEGYQHVPLVGVSSDAAPQPLPQQLHQPVPDMQHGGPLAQAAYQYNTAMHVPGYDQAAHAPPAQAGGQYPTMHEQLPGQIYDQHMQQPQMYQTVAPEQHVADVASGHQTSQQPTSNPVQANGITDPMAFMNPQIPASNPMGTSSYY